MGDFSAKQIGALIRLETEDDTIFLDAATVTQILCKVPRTGEVKTWTATVDGTKLVYITTSATDLPVEGTYELQAHIEGVGWSLSGEIAAMYVHKSLI